MAVRTFFPYAHCSALEMSIDACRIDERANVEVVNRTTRSMDLVDRDDWSKVEIDVCVTVDPATATKVVAPDERRLPPWQMHVLVLNRATRLRRAVDLVTGPKPGVWAGTVSLRRDELKAKTLLQAELVRTTTRSSVPGFAWLRGTRIGSAEPWAVVCDDPEHLFGGLLEGKWEDFPASELDPLRKLGKATHYLDLAGPPVLYLNEAVEGFKMILSTGKKRGVESNFRDALIDSIAQDVHVRLVLAAALSTINTGTDRQPEYEPPTDWARRVLEHYAPRMTGEDDLVTAIQKLVDWVHDPERCVGFVCSLGALTQQHLNVRKSVEALLRNLKSKEAP